MFLTLYLFCALPQKPAVEPPKKGEVSLSVVAAPESPQPAGWPVTVEVKVKNTGTELISWWSGGPDSYPGAEHFEVQVRYSSDLKWHDVEATNGQSQQGSGRNRSLKPGESTSIPLAVPLKLPANRDGLVTVRVRPKRWSAEPTEVEISTSKDLKVLEPYRARMIISVLESKQPFQLHLASKYADEVTTDALIKLINVDNEIIVQNVLFVLANRLELPHSAGDIFAKAIRLWLPRENFRHVGVIQKYLVHVALKTRSEAARMAVLELLKSPDDSKCMAIANVLCVSPGDKKWLQHVREAIAELKLRAAMVPELNQQLNHNIEWLDARIKHDDQSP